MATNPGKTPATSVESIPAPTGAANLIDTDYVIGQDNIKRKFFDVHGKVFTISALTIVLFVVVTLALRSEVEPLFTRFATGSPATWPGFSSDRQTSSSCCAWG